MQMGEIQPIEMSLEEETRLTNALRFSRTAAPMGKKTVVSKLDGTYQVE